MLPCLGPVIPLPSGSPNADIVDRSAGQVKLESKVLAGTINDGVFAEDKIIITQVSNNFVVPVFNSYGLPLAAARFSDAIAKESWDNPSVTINRRVDLEVTGMDLGDAVIATAAACHEAQVCRFSG